MKQPNIFIGIIGIYSIFIFGGLYNKLKPWNGVDEWGDERTTVETFNNYFSENWLIVAITIASFVLLVYVYMYQDYLYDFWLSFYSSFINPANLGFSDIMPSPKIEEREEDNGGTTGDEITSGNNEITGRDKKPRDDDKHEDDKYKRELEKLII